MWMSTNVSAEDFWNPFLMAAFDLLRHAVLDRFHGC